MFKQWQPRRQFMAGCSRVLFLQTACMVSGVWCLIVHPVLWWQQKCCCAILPICSSMCMFEQWQPRWQCTIHKWCYNTMSCTSKYWVHMMRGMRTALQMVTSKSAAAQSARWTALARFEQWQRPWASMSGAAVCRTVHILCVVFCAHNGRLVELLLLLLH